MDLGTLLAYLGGLGALIGGAVSVFYARAQGIAGVVDVLKERIEEIVASNREKDVLIMDLKEQVRTLTELVTSKADVESVKQQLDLIKGILDRIAEKVGVA